MSARIVLGVDDSSDDLMLLSLACQSARVSFQLKAVHHGDLAISYLQGRDQFSNREEFPFPALVLLDLKMPGTSGFEVLSWIRSQAVLRQLPVFVFTASVHTEDRVRAMELGASEYVVKPVGYDDLQAFVRTIDRILLRSGTEGLSSMEVSI